MIIQLIFFVPIVAVGLAAGAHATAYLHGEAAAHKPRFWAFFLLTLAAMSAVVFAPGKIAFLLAWEAMGLASAGLVAFENTEKSVRRATWIYLLACHAGACALMLAGVLLSSQTGETPVLLGETPVLLGETPVLLGETPVLLGETPVLLGETPVLLGETPVLLGSGAFLAAFFCAIVGFGLKIGFPPFHVWLPEAHPAAPAPASAVMSGAMIPLGFYGLCTFFMPGICNAPQEALCGWTILTLGLIGALGGILFALPQVNLKKLLAFSSVENMGVIAIGLGLSILCDHGATANAEADIAYGFALAGALVHVLNHAFLKGALFLGAGSVLRQTGTLDQDRLGGLLKRMPFTGSLFTINALGLAGLPPLNGFLGELLIYISAFHAIRSGLPSLILGGFLAFTVLALTGGLAAAAYCKAIGATFLGEPRSEAAAKAVETPRVMWLAQLGLLTLSICMIPLTIVFAARLTRNAATAPLLTAAIAGLALTGLTLALLALRRFVCPRGKIKPACPTWDCGYHDPTARMAYTGTAFTQPLTDLFDPVLNARKHVIPFKGHPSAPTDAAFASETDDRAISGFWRPLFTSAARAFQRAHLLQNGSLHLYILLIILAVITLLIAAFAS